MAWHLNYKNEPAECEASSPKRAHAVDSTTRLEARL